MQHELWPHQRETLAALKASVAQRVFRIAVQAPTGAGKTMIAAAIVEGAQRKGNRLAFVVHALGLIDQTVEAFYAEGIRDIGVIQADHTKTDWSKPIQVCSVQTLQSRGAYPEAKVVVIDECHVLHKFHKKWLGDPLWVNVPFIGLSATPWTKGLGKYFETLLVSATTQELIDKGHLSNFRAFASSHPDLKGVKTVAGDYHEGQLSAAMQKGDLSADIVRTWQEKWGKDRTLLFAVDCAHAKALQDRFIEAGIACGYQDAHTPMSERAQIKRDFHNGALPIVANIGTLTTGVDWDVRCLILARPTKSEMLYVQIIGRALRTAPGKEHAMIFDHSDTTKRLGLVTDIHHDHLDDGREKGVAEPKVRLPKPCPACTCLMIGLKCPNCGYEKKVQSVIIEDASVDLIEYKRGSRLATKAGKREFSMPEKRVFYAMLLGYGEEHGYKPGWASNKYRNRFGVWPQGMRNMRAIRPDGWTRSWIKTQQIAWIESKKRMEKENAGSVGGPDRGTGTGMGAPSAQISGARGPRAFEAAPGRGEDSALGGRDQDVGVA